MNVLGFPRSSRLAFPGTAPRLAGKHLALTRDTRLVAVATPHGAIDLAHSTKATINASAVFVPTIMGPGIAPTAAAGIAFPSIAPSESYGTATTLAYTLAAIFTYKTESAVRSIMSPVAVANWAMQVTTAGNLTFTLNGGTDTFSGFPALTVGHGYFCAMSTLGSTVIGVLVDLTTGQTSTSAGSGATAATLTSTSTYWMGGPSLVSSVSAVCIVKASMSLSRLLEWAKDPWGLWYSTGDRLSMATSALVTPARQPLATYDTIDIQTRTALLNSVATALGIPTRETYDENSLTASINTLATEMSLPTVETADEQSITRLINSLLAAL